ncbi:hypothetical protein ACLOJK_034281 [Asimina triloba]
MSTADPSASSITPKQAKPTRQQPLISASSSHAPLSTTVCKPQLQPGPNISPIRRDEPELKFWAAMDGFRSHDIGRQRVANQQDNGHDQRHQPDQRLDPPMASRPPSRTGHEQLPRVVRDPNRVPPNPREQEKIANTLRQPDNLQKFKWNLVDPFHSQEVSQSSTEKVQGDMEEGDTESVETELEGHDKGKEIHYEDFSKYQPKVPFPSALEGNHIGEQKPDQSEDSSDQMLEKEVVDETKAPTEAKFVSRMEEAEIVEQEPPKSCIPVMSSMPPSVNLNEKNTPQVKLKTISETKAPTKVKFVCQMEEAEKVKQEIPKSCIPIMSSMPPSVTLNEEKAPQVEFEIIPPSIRSEPESELWRKDNVI